MIKWLFIFIGTISVFGQNSFSLDELIQKAQNNTIEKKQAELNQKEAIWKQDLWKASLKPQLNLRANLPNFYKSSSPITQPDGSIYFLPISQDNSLLNLGLSKQIAKTNTRLFADFNFNRYQNFEDNSILFNTVPFRVGIEQGLMKFNPLKWEKQINEIDVAIANKNLNQENEQRALDVVFTFFEALLYQVSKQIAETNKNSNQKNFTIAEERYALGILSKDDLYQLELRKNQSEENLITSQRMLLNSDSDLKKSTNFETESDSILRLDIPDKIEPFTIDAKSAEIMAWENRPEKLENQKAILQAQSALEEEKRTRGLQLNLQGSVGIIGSSDKLIESYTNTRPDIFVQVGLSLPILDGGQRKIATKTRQAQLDFILEKNVFNEAVFKQNVRQLAQQFNLIQNEIQLSKKNLELAQKRYEIANQRYVLNSISITDLSLAFAERDSIWLSHIALLKSYWTLYYALRALTLYDFRNDKPIEL